MPAVMLVPLTQVNQASLTEQNLMKPLFWEGSARHISNM